jgi:hypothetical protein
MTDTIEKEKIERANEKIKIKFRKAEGKWIVKG